MFKTKSFKGYLPIEDSFACGIVDFLNNNHINREDIVGIKYAVNNDCMLIWEE